MHTGPAELPFDVRVDVDGVALQTLELDEVFGVAHADRAQHDDPPGQEASRDERRRELDTVQVELLRDLTDFSGSRVVEHAEGGDTVGNRCTNRRGLLNRHAP